MSKFRLVLIAIFILCNIASYAQMKVLFVKDEDLNFGNTDTLKAAINGAGSTLSFYSIPDSGHTPTLTQLKQFDLVIWYAATDGVGLSFWQQADGDTSTMAKYIQQGGMLWVIGVDLLYNKYGGPPVAMQNTEFAYKYMGISNYSVQSYGNDGGTGLPQANPAPNTPYTNSSILTWIYSTLWWVDGCQPKASAIPSYVMGPATYSLAGYACEIVNVVGNRPVVSTFFDPSLIDTYPNRVNYVKAVLNMFRAEVTPVELASFNIVNKEKSNLLSWATSTETNNSYFEIERKSENRNFTAIGRVNGAGNSAEIKHYSYNDNVPVLGNYTYRLKQVDYNGTFSYSKAIEVKMIGSNANSLSQSYPNPATNNKVTNIEYTLASASDVRLEIYTIQGELVKVLVNTFEQEGKHTVSFNTANLPSGLYIYTLHTGSDLLSKKLVVVN